MTSLSTTVSQDLKEIDTCTVNYEPGIDTIKEEKISAYMDAINIDMKPDLTANHDPLSGIEISNVKVKAYECDTCKRKFADRYKLQRHQLIHTGEKPYTCDVCQKAFTRKDKMNAHKKKMHLYPTPNMRMYQNFIAKNSSEKEDLSEVINASNNDKNYDLEDNLFEHTSNTLVETPIENNMDISEFLQLNLVNDSSLINKEIINTALQDFKVDKPAMPYKCDNCKTDFACKASLLIHSKTCSNPKQDEHYSYFCDEECGKSFKTAAMKNKHMESHMKIECSICDKNFTRKETLTKHMRIHTGEKPFSCDLCGKVYAYKSDMNQHKKVCANKNQVEKLGIICFICGKSFTRKQSLIQHVRLHTGERPYACNICGQAFTSNSHVHRHKNLIHKKRLNIPEETNIKLELGETFVNSLHKEASNGCEKNRLDIKDEASTEEKIKMESPEDQDFNSELIEIKCSPTLEGTDLPKELINNEMNHERVDIYPCKICNEAFDEKGELVAHQISHLEGNQLGFS